MAGHGHERRWFGAAAALGSLALSLALVEGLLRVVEPPPVSGPAFHPWVPTGRQGDLPELHGLMELGRPNARGIFKGRFYRSNSQGARGPERTPLAAPGVLRILCLGDSVTMGSGVDEEEAYPALLEKALNADGGDLRVEVVNLGLSGLNLPSIVARLERIGLDYHPDLLVYGWTINDIEGPAYTSSSPGGSHEGYKLRYHRFDESPWRLLRTLWPRAMSLQDALAPPRGSYPWDARHNYFDNEAAWGQFEGALERLASLGREHGACVHMLVHTHLFALRLFHPFLGIYDKVAATGAARGMTVTPTWPAVRGLDEAGLIVAPDDPHPNAEGHRLFAQALADGIRALPSECLRPAVREP